MTFNEAKEIVAKRDGYRYFSDIPFHLFEEYTNRAAEEYANSVKLKVEDKKVDNEIYFVDTNNPQIPAQLYESPIFININGSPGYLIIDINKKFLFTSVFGWDACDLEVNEVLNRFKIV